MRQWLPASAISLQHIVIRLAACFSWPRSKLSLSVFGEVCQRSPKGELCDTQDQRKAAAVLRAAVVLTEAAVVSDATVFMVTTVVNSRCVNDLNLKV